MTQFCIITGILTLALFLFLIYALCAAAARADVIGDMLAEQARRQTEGKVRP